MLRVHPDFLDEDLFVALQKAAKEIEGQFIPNFYWEKGLQTAFPVLTFTFYYHDTDAPEPKISGSVPVELVRALAERIRAAIPGMRIRSIAFHAFPAMSHVPWHSDAEYGGGATIYLNDAWDRRDGGYFAYHKDPKSPHIECILPTRNLCVAVSQGLDHCTTPVAVDCPERRSTIQVFLDK
jgi:hypothetical protein